MMRDEGKRLCLMMVLDKTRPAEDGWMKVHSRELGAT